MHLEEVETPAPRRGEVLVRVHAVSVNRSLDLDVRAGRHYDSKLPLVPGIDPSGEVTALGKGVETLRIGDRVSVTGATVPCCECDRCLAERPEHCSDRQ